MLCHSCHTCFTGCGEMTVSFSLATCQQITMTTRHTVCSRLSYDSSHWMWSVWPVDKLLEQIILITSACFTFGWSHVYQRILPKRFVSLLFSMPLCRRHHEEQDAGFYKISLTKWSQLKTLFLAFSELPTISHGVHQYMETMWYDWKIWKELVSGPRVGNVWSNYYLNFIAELLLG